MRGTARTLASLCTLLLFAGGWRPIPSGLWCSPVADLLTRSPRFVYLRVKLPADVWDALRSRFQSDNCALQFLRGDWEVLVRSLAERFVPR